MKRIIMLFNLLGIALLAFSQGEVAPDEKTFYGGVAYYYLNLNADLSSYQSTNKIDGQTFEPRQWNSDEISDFNNYVYSEQTWMSPSLVLGMKMYDKPESPWSLNAELMLGYLLQKHAENDKNTGNNLLEVKNDARVNLFSKIDFDLKYAWKKWIFTLNPGFSYGIAHSKSISYNYLPEADYESDYNLRSTMYFPQLNLTAGYSLWNINIYAGMGFGQYYNTQKLEITKSSQYQTFTDEIKVEFKGQSNLMGVAGFDWQITDQFMWKLKTEIGIGFIGQTSFAILF